MKTLNQHLFRALIPGFLLVLIASGLLIQVLVGRNLNSEFDRGLVARAEALMAITEQDEDGVELEVYPDALSSYFDEVEPDYFEIRDSSGNRLFYSDSLAADQYLLSNNTLGKEDDDRSRIDNVMLPDGRRGRLIQREYFPKIDIDNDELVKDSGLQRQERVDVAAFAPSGTPVEVNGIVIIPERVHLLIATSRKALDANLTQLNIILLFTGLLTLSAVVLLQRGAIRRAIRPIENISKQISDLDVDQLDRRLLLHHPILELDALVKRFNSMLERLNEGFTRERQFSADLAHEMRTPLSELRSLVEVSQRWPSDEVLRASFNDDVLFTVSRMERLIQSLLSLSRGNLGLIQPTGAVDLAHLIRQVACAHQKSDRTRQQSISLSIPPYGVIVNGEDHWPGILENLVDNAMEYSPADSTVSVSLTVDQRKRTFLLSIENEAAELTMEDVSHLFDRLWRKDKARTSDRHCGLGLSLVHMYVETAGAEVHAETAADDRLRIVVSGSFERLMDVDAE